MAYVPGPEPPLVMKHGYCSTLCYRIVPVLVGRRHEGNPDVVQVLNGANHSQVIAAIPKALEEYRLRGLKLWNLNDYTAENVRAYDAWEDQFRYTDILEALAKALER